MRVLTDSFVGRAEELGLLEHALDELELGTGGAIELVGEPGIGKTRLLGELAARAEQRGHLVLSGSGAELEQVTGHGLSLPPGGRPDIGAPP